MSVSVNTDLLSHLWKGVVAEPLNKGGLANSRVANSDDGHLRGPGNPSAESASHFFFRPNQDHNKWSLFSLPLGLHAILVTLSSPSWSPSSSPRKHFSSNLLKMPTLSPQPHRTVSQIDIRGITWEAVKRNWDPEDSCLPPSQQARADCTWRGVLPGPAQRHY